MTSVRGDPRDIEFTRDGSPMATKRCGSSTGSVRSTTAFTRVKIALLAPIPRPRVSATTAAKPALRRSVRSA